MHKKFWSEKPEGGDGVEDLGIDGKVNNITNPREIGWKGVEWMHLAQYTEQWRALANTLMNLRVP
jgi:hypothetical protein